MIYFTIVFNGAFIFWAIRLASKTKQEIKEHAEYLAKLIAEREEIEKEKERIDNEIQIFRIKYNPEYTKVLLK